MDARDLPTDVQQLREFALQLRSQLNEASVALAETNTALAEKSIALSRSTGELAQAREEVEQLSATVLQQQQKLEAREQQILELLKSLRGKQRERIDPDQLFLFEIGELEQLIEESIEQEADAKRPRRRKRGRRIIPDDIPREIIEHTLPEEERLCPIDGKPMPVIRWIEHLQLDYIPAVIRAILHRRAVYGCPEKHDQATLLTAPKPPQPIEKGLATAGLLAQVVVSKFGDHLPGYRQEDILARHGVNIRRSTIYDWLAQVADLCHPLYDLMVERVLASKVIHTDDTQVKLIDRTLRSTRTARFWG